MQITFLVLAVAIDVYCLVYWTEEDKVTVVQMCNVIDGTTGKLLWC